jgi:nitroreductase
METLNAIEQRWGCRKYLPKPVEKEYVGIVLDAARYAPSAGNLQDRSFVVVKNDSVRQEIAHACGNQNWMMDAPVHIVIVSENQKNSKFFGEKGEKIYTVQDTAFAAQNMLLAATDLGLGCSLVVGFNEQKIVELLGIKEPAKPHIIITLGWAAENPKPSSKYALDKFVFFEKYGNRIENMALYLGEWSTFRKQIVTEVSKEVKREAPKLIDKIREKINRLFKREEAPIGEDHFMETPGEKKVKMKEMKKEYEEEIPRQLPKK